MIFLPYYKYRRKTLENAEYKMPAKNNIVVSKPSEIASSQMY